MGGKRGEKCTFNLYFVVLHEAQSIQNAAAACIGAGTGLGACYILPTQSVDGSIDILFFIM
jgi:glucokinase